MKESSLEDLAQHLVRPMVSKPDAVSAKLVEEDRGMELRVSVDASDVGRVIGRQGRTIRSLRNLVDVAGQRHGQPVRLEIDEPEAS